MRLLNIKLTWKHSDRIYSTTNLHIVSKIGCIIVCMYNQIHSTDCEQCLRQRHRLAKAKFKGRILCKLHLACGCYNANNDIWIIVMTKSWLVTFALYNNNQETVSAACRTHQKVTLANQLRRAFFHLHRTIIHDMHRYIYTYTLNKNHANMYDIRTSAYILTRLTRPYYLEIPHLPPIHSSIQQHPGPNWESFYTVVQPNETLQSKYHPNAGTPTDRHGAEILYSSA